MIAVGGGVPLALALGGGGDGDDAVSTSTSPSTIGGGSGEGPGPIVDIIDPVTTTSTPTTSTTAPPTTTTQPATTVPAMSQAAVDAALLTPEDLGAGFVGQPAPPDVAVGCVGDGSGIPTTFASNMNATRGLGQQDQLTIGHSVFAYADTTNASNDYQAFVAQLDACNGATQDIAGLEYRLEIMQASADPADLPAACPDLRLVTVHLISTSGVTPDLWQTNAVFRCGRNGSVISLAALDATSVLDTALVADLATRASTKLLQLDGSLDT